MKRIVNFVLVGLPASGKSYFANILNQYYQYNIIEIGDYVRKES
jgi:dephospho-CoA kinase